MTNDQIVQAAREAGYEAEIRAGAVLVRLYNRAVSVAEISVALNLPPNAAFISFIGPLWVLGSDSFEASKPAYGLDWAEHMALQGDVDETDAATMATTGRM